MCPENIIHFTFVTNNRAVAGGGGGGCNGFFGPLHKQQLEIFLCAAQLDFQSPPLRNLILLLQVFCSSQSRALTNKKRVYSYKY